MRAAASTGLLAAVLVGVYLMAGGCGSCTEIGCQNGVTVELSGPGDGASVRACVAEHCARERVIVEGRRAFAPVAMPSLPDTSDVDVSVTVYGRSGRVLARAQGRAPVSVNRPNGPDCPPECRHVGVRVEGRRLVPEANG